MSGANNPFVGNQGQPEPAKIPFEPFERKLLGKAARMMLFAGSADLAVGVLTILSFFAGSFSVVGVLRGLAFIGVGVLTILPFRALIKVDGQPKDDLADLDAAFNRIRVLFVTKAAAAGIMIALALTAWRLMIRSDIGL